MKSASALRWVSLREECASSCSVGCDGHNKSLFQLFQRSLKFICQVTNPLWVLSFRMWSGWRRWQLTRASLDNTALLKSLLELYYTILCLNWILKAQKAAQQKAFHLHSTCVEFPRRARNLHCYRLQSVASIVDVIHTTALPLMNRGSPQHKQRNCLVCPSQQVFNACCVGLIVPLS